MSAPKFPRDYVGTAIIENGVLRIRNRPHVERWASLQRNGEYTFTIERLTARRSLEQNALYWAGYVDPLCEHTGYRPREMHLYLKARFLPAAKRKTHHLLLQNRAGEVIDEFEIDMSTTTTLNRIEFGDYLDEIQAFAATLGVTCGSNRGLAGGRPRRESESMDAEYVVHADERARRLGPKQTRG